MRTPLALLLLAAAAPAGAQTACTVPAATVANVLTGHLGGLSSRIRLSSVRAEVPCVVEDPSDASRLVAMNTPDGSGNERRLMTFSVSYGWTVMDGFGGTVRPALFGLSMMRARQVLENNGLTFFGTLGEGHSTWQFTAPYGCARLDSDDEGGVVGVSASSRPCAAP